MRDVVVLTCLLLSVPASAHVDGFPRTEPPTLSDFLEEGYEIKTTFTDNGRLFVVVQKGGTSAWCETKIGDDGSIKSKPCVQVGRRD